MELIKNKLDEYLEFDSSLLLTPIPSYDTPNNLLIRVFGGAIRDIISGDKINDIDILVGSDTFHWAKKVLKENGYFFQKKLSGKDIQVAYEELKVISEPHTFTKNDKVVQLIRPRLLTNKKGSFFDKQREYKNNFVNLIQNVDYSCCAVSYDGTYLYQNFPNSILHCQNKVFITNMKALMYSDKRALHRKYKLMDRGWEEIENNKQIERDEKINNLLECKETIDFKNEIQKHPDEIYESVFKFFPKV
jgi:hypothetical protein